MLLSSFSYKEPGWDLSALSPLSIVNLLVGRNATGKTRSIRALRNVIAFLQTKSLFMAPRDMSTELVFTDPTKDNWMMTYSFMVANGTIAKESLVVNGKVLIKRTKAMATYLEDTINPPSHKLVVQIRRDEELFPEIEQLMSWVEGVVFVSCSDINSMTISFGSDDFGNPDRFSDIVDALSPKEKKLVLTQAKELGFDITGMETMTSSNLKFVMIKEKSVRSMYGDFQMSNGMLRVLYFLCFLHYIKKNDKLSLLLVDDLGESLDYGRSVRLGKMVFDACENDGLQLIASSNDAFLMDAVDISRWQVLRRRGSKVTAINSTNNADLFNDFRLTGLSNFDLFSSDFIDNYLNRKAE